MLRLTATRVGLPIVMLLDDLHWADEGSLDFFTHLMQVARDMPLLLLAFTRPGLFERRPGWANLEGAARRIDLEPLSKGHSRELANVLLQRIADPPALLHYERAGDYANACHYFTRAAEGARARGAHPQMLECVERALALAAADDHATRWRLLVLRERYFVTREDRVAHAADLDTLQALADALADDALRADVLWRRAYALDNAGDFAAAALAERKSLALALAAGATEIATKAFAGLGFDLLRLGRFVEAQRAVDDGLALARKTGFREVEPHLLTDAGGIASARGDHAAAVAYFEEALAITREIGNPGDEAMMLNNLGDGALRMGDYSAARCHLDASVEISRATGNRSSESLALQNLAAVAHLQGDDASALAWAQAALDIQVAMDQRQGQGITLNVIGHAELVLGRPAAAHAAYRRARDLFVDIDMPTLAMEAVAGLARTALAQGDIGQTAGAIEALLAHHDGGNRFQGAEQPLRILLTCWQSLSAVGDPRAPELLASAHAELQAQAARITDARLRAGLLQGVPHHREIVEAWASHGPAAGA